MSTRLFLIMLASILLTGSVTTSKADTSKLTESEEHIEPYGPLVPPPPRPSTAVLMAQMCVSEISWQKDTRECQLMMEINYRNAKKNGISAARQTRIFNAYFKHPNRSRRWIQYLNPEGTKPLFWPKNASWTTHKKYWDAYLKLATEFPGKFAHRWYPALCARADDYGGRCDDKGLHACDTPKQGKCARQIRCLPIATYQAYWNLECCRNKDKCKDSPLDKANKS